MKEKKFKLQIFIGKAIIYESILIFKKKDIAWISNRITNIGRDSFSDEIIPVLKNLKKENILSEIDDMDVKDIVKKYPDETICAYIQNKINMSGVFSGLENFGGLEELRFLENKKSVKNNIGEYGCKCLPI